MPLMMIGPPEWHWQRTAQPVRWQVRAVHTEDAGLVYEVSVIASAGTEVLRLGYFTPGELSGLAQQLREALG
jgi:hypothetical protein